MNTSQLRRSAGISQYGAISRKPRRLYRWTRRQSISTEPSTNHWSPKRRKPSKTAITTGVGKGGKLRKAGDKRKNVRDAFRNAVNRAIKQIEKWDKPLAEHLKASIKHGNEVVYRPGMPIAWDVRSIVNA